MRKVKIVDGSCSLYERDDVADLYTMSEVRNYPKIDDEEISKCNVINLGEEYVMGFVKQEDYTDENPTFIQMYHTDVEELEELEELPE